MFHAWYSDARCARAIESWIAAAKTPIGETNFFTSKLDLNFGKKLVKWYTWSVALYGAYTWTLRKGDQNYLGSSEM
jgi:hypothetical protein